MSITFILSGHLDGFFFNIHVMYFFFFIEFTILFVLVFDKPEHVRTEENKRLKFKIR